MHVGASEPTVRLPSWFVTMRATDGINSWFNMYIFNVSNGFDVVNGTYQGWCIEKDTNMTRHVNHTVRLYSSYDPTMPVDFQSNNWDKVNYIINNKQGGRENIQRAIWYYICNDPYPTNDTLAQSMINNATTSGDGFIPQPGQKVAILVEVINGIYSIQRTFFELPLPYPVMLGDLVWNDYNANGIQDANEPGIQGISVGLYTPNGTEVDLVTTDSQGRYSFIFPAGDYYIQFTLPSGYRFSPANQGSDDTKDSDADPTTGRTAIATFNPEQNDTSWDAGMYRVNEQGNPVPPSSPSNHAPTADGTAGEPYTAFVGEELHFNGSRSYDRDGTIISWHWSFGDGTSANSTTVTHVYTAEGTYPVSLTVTDDDGATDTYSTVARIKVPNRPPLPPTVTGPTQGNQGVLYTFNMVATDPDDDNVRYLVLWGDGIQSTTIYFRSGHSVDAAHQWSTWGFYTVQVYAQDPSNVTSDASTILVAIDVQYVGSLGYLINTDGIGPYDAFYSNLTGNQTSAQREKTGIYLIDTNGDGSYDYQYDPSSGSYRPYPETLEPPYMILLVGVIVVILILLLIGFFVRRRGTKPNQ
jgi:PKD repeat protein